MDLDRFLESDLVKKPFCVLFGHPVAHSMSPLMHNTAAKQLGIRLTYTAIDLPILDSVKITRLLNEEHFLGANITIPHKAAIIKFVDNLEAVAEDIGAVNTIYRNDYRIIGSNTDVYGFSVPLDEYIDSIDGRDAIVFGTGGASRAVVYALGTMGIQHIYMVSRSPHLKKTNIFTSDADVHILSYDAWPHFIDEAGIIVNTTPLGMEPNIEKSPVRDQQVQYLSDKICYDIVPKPMNTRFIQQAQEAGCIAINGLDMLIHQGSKSFEIWTGKEFPIEMIRNLLINQFHE
ncbi:MAG TPA: shikimate dehydrogenase [Balneolales bacterium]|nr:shikimate dehydrogenase [Balneolales bacterium]